MNYIKRVAIAVDQLIAAVVFGCMPDETISAMAHRRGWKRTERVINWVFQDDLHCSKSYVSEMVGAQLPPDYRK